MRKTVPIVIAGHKDIEELRQPPWRYASDLSMNVPIFQGYSSFPRTSESGTQGLKRLLLDPAFAGVTVTNCKHEIHAGSVCTFSPSPRACGERVGVRGVRRHTPVRKSSSERCPSPGIRAFAQMPTSPRKRGSRSHHFSPSVPAFRLSRE